MTISIYSVVLSIRLADCTNIGLVSECCVQFDSKRSLACVSALYVVSSTEHWVLTTSKEVFLGSDKICSFAVTTRSKSDPVKR